MTPKDYEELAKKAYSVDSNFKDGEVTHKGQEFNINGKRWKVLEAKDNQGNGFQGMAVAPMEMDNQIRVKLLSLMQVQILQTGKI